MVKKPNKILNFIWNVELPNPVQRHIGIDRIRSLGFQELVSRFVREETITC